MLATAVQHGLRGGCWPAARAERRLEIVSTGCDTSGDAGAVAVKSVSDSELEELRTPPTKVMFVGVQSAARARPQKYRGCATEALAATVQHGLRGGCWS